MSASASSHWLRWLFMAVAVLVAAFVLLVVDPSAALLFRIVGLIGIALFALSLMMTEAATLAGGQTPYAVALVSFLGMGLAVGNSFGLLARYARVRRQTRAAILGRGEK